MPGLDVRQKMKKKLLLSIFASAVLWVLFPVILRLLTSGWTGLWSGFPRFPFLWIAVFLPVAAIMHFLFAGIVLKLKGWIFWIFPLISLWVASHLYWILMVITKGTEGMMLYPVVFAIVFVSMIWVSYPLAIINQFIIQKLLAEPDG